jgi:hypothetical protein
MAALCDLSLLLRRLLLLLLLLLLLHNCSCHVHGGSSGKSSSSDCSCNSPGVGWSCCVFAEASHKTSQRAEHNPKMFTYVDASPVEFQLLL